MSCQAILEMVKDGDHCGVTGAWAEGLAAVSSQRQAPPWRQQFAPAAACTIPGPL